MENERIIETEAARLAEVVTAADPAAAVPTCPDWDAKQLLWHLTSVHRFWADVLTQNPQTDDEVAALEPDEDAPAPDSLDQILSQRAAATADLTAALRALPDDAPRWSWWDADQTVGFTRRMQTCEATMHRIDAELSAGVPVTALDPAVAAACVTQCVDVMWGWMPQWASWERLAVVELHATDTGQRWPLEIGHWFGVGPSSGKSFDEMRATRAHGGEVTGTVSGPVDQLSRWAWNRMPEAGSVQVTGTPEARDAVGRLTAQGIQ